jgi:O-antigen ligase
MEKHENAGGKGRWIALLFMVTLVFWFVWMGRTRIKAAPTE